MPSEPLPAPDPGASPGRTYDSIAREYAGDEAWEEDPPLRAACRRMLAERLLGREVLEVGCGPGTDAARLQAEGLRVTATDACEPLLRVVRARYPAMRAVRMDMSAPCFRPGSFDGIYGFASFVHLPRAAGPGTLRGFRELLRPGGVLLLHVIESTLHREYTVPDWGGVPGNSALFTCYGREEIVGLARAAGFDAAETRSTPSAFYDAQPRLTALGVRGYQLIATASGPRSPAPGGGAVGRSPS